MNEGRNCVRESRKRQTEREKEWIESHRQNEIECYWMIWLHDRECFVFTSTANYVQLCRSQYAHIAHSSKWMEYIYHRNENIFRRQANERVRNTHKEREREKEFINMMCQTLNSRIYGFCLLIANGKSVKKKKIAQNQSVFKMFTLFPHNLSHTHTLNPLAIALISRQMI